MINWFYLNNPEGNTIHTYDLTNENNLANLGKSLQEMEDWSLEHPADLEVIF